MLRTNPCFRLSGLCKSFVPNSQLSLRKPLTNRASLHRRFSTQRPLWLHNSSAQWKGALKSPNTPEIGKRDANPVPRIEAPKTKITSKSKAPTISELKILKDLFKYIWPSGDNKVRFRVLTALALLIGAKLLNVQVPFFFKDAVDSMNIEWSDATTVLPIAITLTVISYGAARFGAVLFGEIRNAVFASVAQNAIRKVSLQTFQHLMRLDLGWHLSRQTGGLTRAMDRGTKGISYILSAMVFHIIPIAFEISVVCGILTYQFGTSFAAVTFATMLLYSIFTFKTTAWRTEFRRSANRADNKAASVALDSLINFEAVKYFNNERYLADKYHNSLTNYTNSQIKVAQSLAFLNSGQNLIFTSALTAMMYMGCTGVMSGDLSVGDLVLINQLVFQLSVPLNFLGSVYRELKQSLIDMESLFKLQKNKVNIQNSKTPLMLPKDKPCEIKFENVTFGYHPDRKILENANFTLPAGWKTAIVGPSGSGKSTILKLVFRFYDPQEGCILIDGKDIRELDLKSLRRAIGVVPQDTPLFNDTIWENVKFGKITATDDDIRKAIDKAQLAPLIHSLPQGSETIVGERGLMISGGEKQRLAIARVLLKDTPIMFFDEATSALDTHTEQALLRTIKENFAGNSRTSIYIAHRLRTIADADKIVVLENGRVKEEGKHAELLSKPTSLYSELWNIQENLDLLEEEIEMDKKQQDT